MLLPRILIVDDDKDMTGVLSKRLSNSGFSVHCTDSGHEALEYLKINPVNLVLLDLLLPGMNGYEVLQKIRSDEMLNNIPVIMVTGKTGQEAKIKGLKMGLDDYMTKPFDWQELIARIIAVLKRSKPRKSNRVKNVLVTGGSGFIGSALVRELLKRNFTVTIIDDFSTGRKENISDLLVNKNLSLVTGSITDEALVGKAIEESDLVYHLAATVGVKNVVDNPLETVMYDTIGTSIVLKYASAKGVKTVLTSTSEVYGKSKKFPFKENEDVVIGPPQVSRWSYACSKLLDEFFALGYHEQRKLPVVIVRLFNIVGPGQLGRYGMVVPRFFKMALKGEPIVIYGSGKQIRCFTYIYDAIEVIIKLANTESANGEVINLGSENQVSIKDLALKIKKITNSKSKIVFEPYEKYYGKNFQDIEKRIPDLTKLKKIAGIIPKTNLEEILEKTKQYFKENPQALERL